MGSVSVSQSTLIVGGLMAAFLVWVTLNKHLGNYFADLGLGSSSVATSTGAIGAGVGGTINAGSIFKPGSLFESWFGGAPTGGSTGTTGGL